MACEQQYPGRARAILRTRYASSARTLLVGYRRQQRGFNSQFIITIVIKPQPTHLTVAFYGMRENSLKMLHVTTYNSLHFS